MCSVILDKIDCYNYDYCWIKRKILNTETFLTDSKFWQCPIIPLLKVFLQGEGENHGPYWNNEKSKISDLHLKFWLITETFCKDREKENSMQFLRACNSANMGVFQLVWTSGMLSCNTITQHSIIRDRFVKNLSGIFFLCIFRNFLCIYKKWLHWKSNAS